MRALHRRIQQFVYTDVLEMARCGCGIAKDSNYFDAYLDHLAHRMIDIILESAMAVVLRRIG